MVAKKSSVNKKVRKTNSDTKARNTPATPDNEYMKMCRAKQSRNNEYLAKVLADIKTKQKSTSSTPTNSPKKSTSKARAQSNITTPPKNTAKKKALSSKKATKKSVIAQKCTHNDISAFNEETDRRYFSKGWDLHGSKCMTCNIKFGEGTNIPSISQPIYVCNNRIATGCKHAFCQDCYLIKMKSDTNRNRSR